MTIERIEYNEQSFLTGYQAGLDGKGAAEGIPQDITDGLAYFSGLIEGQADRSKPPDQRKPHTPPSQRRLAAPVQKDCAAT